MISKAKLIPHAQNHWNIISACYQEGCFHIEFHDFDFDCLALQCALSNDPTREE